MARARRIGLEFLAQLGHVDAQAWEDAAALKAHGVAPHMQAYRSKVKDYVKGMELRVLTPA
jgi:quinol monooxygenase YgiN